MAVGTRDFKVPYSLALIMRRKDKGCMWCQNPPGPLKNKYNMKTKEFKVGDKVFDIRYGWGIVGSINYDDLYPIKVSYMYGKTFMSYSIDGKDASKNINPILSHTEYSIHSTQSEYSKVMEVSDDGKNWKRRVVFKEKQGKFLAWAGIETLEEVEDMVEVTSWNFAREIQEPREISIQEIADKFGIPVEEVRIKK